MGRTRAEYDDDVQVIHAIETIEDDRGPEFTGLLDADGNKLYRYPVKHPCGFDTNPENYRRQRRRRRK